MLILIPQVLYLLSSGFENPNEVLSQALDPPTDRALANAEAVLLEVGAVQCIVTKGATASTHPSPKNPHLSLTPLGRHLSKIPVDVHIAKMMLYAAVFGCVTPILIIAAAVSLGSPFSAPFGKRDAADHAKRKFIGSSESDMLTVFNAYTAWERAGTNTSSRTKFCRENFISESTMVTIADLSREYAQLISSLGFDMDCVYANENSVDVGVIKSVIYAGLRPQVVALTMRPSAPPLARLRAGDARVHPSSVLALMRGHDLEDRIAVFAIKMKTSDTFVRDCTTISPKPVLLFADELVIHHADGLVEVDGWLRFRSPAKTAVIFKGLKRELNKVLARKAVDPTLSVADDKFVKAIVSVMSGASIPR